MSDLLDLLTESVEKADEQLGEERQKEEARRRDEEADFDAWARECMPAEIQKAVLSGQQRLSFSAFVREGKDPELVTQHLARICHKNGVPVVDVQGVDHIDIEALRRKTK